MSVTRVQNFSESLHCKKDAGKPRMLRNGLKWNWNPRYITDVAWSTLVENLAHQGTASVTTTQTGHVPCRKQKLFRIAEFEASYRLRAGLNVLRRR